MQKKLLSVVVSVYNEEAVLQKYYEAATRVLKKISWDYELLFVNDGSLDGSPVILDHISHADKKVKVVNFSKNFGHEAAMIAGIDYAAGDAIICMDADLQHPVECFPRILEKFEQGYEVINMVRTRNASAGWLKNLCSNAFYKVLRFLSNVEFQQNASDFFAVSARVADILRSSYRENVRFLRGYVQNIGFKKTVIEYEAHARAGGASKYNFRKLLQLSINTIVCFSDLPLKLGIFAGIIAAGMGTILLLYTLFTRQGSPGGYATIIVTLCFMFALLFLVIGIIGEYISILFIELKDRPIYITESVRNMGADQEDSKEEFTHEKIVRIVSEK